MRLAALSRWLATLWRKAMFTKSSYSQGNSNCVEVEVERAVRVRDSKLGDRSPVLQFTGRAWRAFLAQYKEDS